LFATHFHSNIGPHLTVGRLHVAHGNRCLERRRIRPGCDLSNDGIGLGILQDSTLSCGCLHSHNANTLACLLLEFTTFSQNVLGTQKATFHASTTALPLYVTLFHIRGCVCVCTEGAIFFRPNLMLLVEHADMRAQVNDRADTKNAPHRDVSDVVILVQGCCAQLENGLSTLGTVRESDL